MNLKKWNIIKLENLFDKCKKCGCSSFECRNCNFQKFYRHIDDKIKMKENMKKIRNKGFNPTFKIPIFKV